MSCPACGETDRKLIGPSYYECLGEWLEPGPAADGSLTAYTVWCGRRYHDGADGDAACSCGKFAAGWCDGCGSAACDEHLVDLATAIPARAGRSCPTCERRFQRERTRDIQDADAARLADRVAAYRALPTMRREHLVAYLNGDDTIADGVTHQMWDWTNADVWAVIEQEFDVGYELVTATGIQDGRRVLRSGGGRAFEKLVDGPGEYSSRRWGLIQGTGPDTRFNDVSAVDATRYTVPARTLATEELSGLRTGLQDELRTRRAHRESAARERLEQVAIAVGCVLVVVAVVVVVLLIV